MFKSFGSFFKAKDSSSIEKSLARLWFSHRTTPNSSTAQTPAKFFLNRPLKTKLDFMRHDLGEKVFDKQRDQKCRIDKGSKEREVTIREQVLVKNSRGTKMA